MRESDERGALLLATPFLLTLIALLIGCENEGRLNIVLISVDTLRANHLTPYGYDRETTPFLASLAEESVLFTDAISQCGTTPQSLSSIMTGLYPFSDRVVGRRKGFVFLRRSNVTLARVLRDLGYVTHAITSSIQSSRATGINLGFESFDGIDVGVDQKMKRRKSGEVTGLAVEWLRARERAEDPFFLWIHYLDPHYPYAAPPRYQRYFEEHHPAEEGEVRFYRFDAIHDKRHRSRMVSWPGSIFNTIGRYATSTMSFVRSLKMGWSITSIRHSSSSPQLTANRLEITRLSTTTISTRPFCTYR